MGAFMLSFTIIRRGRVNVAFAAHKGGKCRYQTHCSREVEDTVQTDNERRRDEIWEEAVTE